MKSPLGISFVFFIAGCTAYERPSARIVPVPEPIVKNTVESIPQAAEVIISDLVAGSKVKERIRVAFLPIENRFLDTGVSTSLQNGLRAELVARDLFEVLKDIDLQTVRKALAAEENARGFIDEGAKVILGRRLGADAVITCTVSDAIQYWQIYVDLTPITTNVVASGATCHLPKRVAMRSQIYLP